MKAPSTSAMQSRAIGVDSSGAEKRSLPMAAPLRWKCQRWGSLADPIHKSHMSTLIGEYACTKQFAFDRQRETEGGVERETVSGKTEMGTAIHETIARALRNAAQRESILAGTPIATEDDVRRVLVREFETACAGRTVNWYGKSDYSDALEDGVAMVRGLFADLHHHVESVELVEAGWIAKFGELWLEGHTDLVYRPRGHDLEALAFTDWKSGAQKPHPIQLDHGFESGFYSLALERGLFLPTVVLDQWREAAARDALDLVPLDPWDVKALGAARDERSAMHIALRALAKRREAGIALPEGVRTFSQFPEVIRLTQLNMYVPYEKKGTKTVERPEDLAHWSRVLGREVGKGEKVTYEKGQARGGAWLTVRRSVDDVPRLETMLRAVVGWVRFGRFVPSVGEKCTRCSYQKPCLTSGYDLKGDDAKDLNAALRGVDLGATDALDD